MFNPWVRKIPWRKAWWPIPVFLPGEFHEQRNLAGWPWGHKESETTERLIPLLLSVTSEDVIYWKPRNKGAHFVFFSLGAIYWRQSQAPNSDSGCHCFSFRMQTSSFSIIPNKHSFNDRLRQFLPDVLHAYRIQEINKREERKRTHTLRKCIVLKSHVFSSVCNSVMLPSLSSYCLCGK